jgi:hypothetical protein
MTHTADEYRLAHSCDRCPAKAVQTVAVGELSLQFCQHHYDQHEDQIRKVLA